MRISKNITPSGKVTKSQGIVENPGITYNEAGVSYNSAYNYGGVYGFSDVQPSFVKATDYKPRVKISKVDAYLEDQSSTYNQSGITYNELLYLYGGIYGFEDLVPLISLARNIGPRITRFDDIYTTPPPVPIGDSGYLIGMLGLTYP